MNESWFDVVLHSLMYSSDLWFIICYLYRCIVYSLLSVQEQTKNFALKNDLKTGGIASKSLSEVKWFYTSRRYKAMVLCSHTVLHGQFSKSRNYYPSITVIFTTIRLSPLLSSHGYPWRSPNSLFVLSSACINGTLYITVVSGQLWHEMAIFVVFKISLFFGACIKQSPCHSRGWALDTGFGASELSGKCDKMVRGEGRVERRRSNPVCISIAW